MPFGSAASLINTDVDRAPSSVSLNTTASSTGLHAIIQSGREGVIGRHAVIGYEGPDTGEAGDRLRGIGSGSATAHDEGAAMNVQYNLVVALERQTIWRDLVQRRVRELMFSDCRWKGTCRHLCDLHQLAFHFSDLSPPAALVRVRICGSMIGKPRARKACASGLIVVGVGIVRSGTSSPAASSIPSAILFPFINAFCASIPALHHQGRPASTDTSNRSSIGESALWTLNIPTAAQAWD